eukprot:COSAG04_NODE_10829_length_750_cov_0.917051_1_plen_21_part_01
MRILRTFDVPDLAMAGGVGRQ